ncbi:permease-like cell division protein FtsX [Peptococcaceae bacterium 1198_IL3148]
MKFSTPFYSLRDALISLVRNGWLTVASIAIVAVSLIILGGSVLLVINSDYLTNKLESNVEISVFIAEETTSKEVSQLGKDIRATAGVEEVKFISKEQALKDMKESFGDQGDILDNLEKNPLNDTYRIKAKDANQVPALAEKFEQMPNVELVRYGKGLVEKLLVITDWVRTASLAVMIILAVAAVFLIATTIRMSVFARRREISIMKYLGATNWFVRAPFLIEGLILGLLGALMAVLVVNLGYTTLIKQLEVSVPFISLVSSGEVLTMLLGVLLGLGVAIGVFGSLVSIHRFLKV